MRPWKDCEYSHGLLGEAVLDEGILICPGRKRIERLCLLAREELVDLSDQFGELRDKLYDAFRNEGNTEVVAIISACLNRVRDLVSDLGERLLLGCDFFTDQADVGLCLQRALKCDMRSGAAHQLDEMPVLLSGISVALDITDHFAVGLGSCIKTEGSLDILVLEVAVDGLGASDDLNACIIRSHILSKYCCVRVGIVAADDHDRGDAVLLAVLRYDLELRNGLKFGSAGADDIETAGISVLIDELVCHLDIIIVDQTARAALEAEKNIILVGCFQCIVKAADDIVSARCLSAGKDHANNLLLSN